MKKLSITLAAVTALSLGTAACGSSSETSDTTIAATPEVATYSVDGAWARTSPMEATMGAVYLNITSTLDDALVGASVSTDIAAMTQVHETLMNADGTMGMQEIASVPMASNTPLALAPGGYHIMLMQLVKPLTVGETISVTLTFASGETTTVDAIVSEEAP
jgi:copper(I)-binding protein